MSIAIRQWHEEGRLQGLAEGEARAEARGEAKGRADCLVRILEARFGSADHVLRHLLSSESADVLGTAIERALVAHTLDEALEPLKRRR